MLAPSLPVYCTHEDDAVPAPAPTEMPEETPKEKPEETPEETPEEMPEEMPDEGEIHGARCLLGWRWFFFGLRGGGQAKVKIIRKYFEV